MNRRNSSAAAAVLGRTDNATSGCIERPARIEISDDSRIQKSPFLLLSGYEGANSSPARGYLWWPTNDSRRALTSYSDAEIRKRINWLVANYGLARRLYLGPAKLLGFLTPHPVTSSDEFNDLAFENFQSRAGSPQIFDRKGREDFFTSQLLLNRSKFKDGRILAAFAETASKGASVAFYEAHQIKNGPNDADGRYHDGVELDKFDRHVGWRVQDGKDPEKFERIDARDGHYYGNFDSPGPVHGISILAHAVVNMIDVVELRGMRKHAAKNAAQLGIAVEKDRAMAVVSGVSTGLGGPLVSAQVDVGDGTTQEVKWEMMTTQGQVPVLAPGERIRVVTDDRPTPNNLEFDRALIEDCIYGIDLPAAALYAVTGTGPTVRFNLEEIRRWIIIQHRQLAQWCQRYYAVHMAREVAAGRLPQIDEPYWREVEWVGLPDMTIDRGREASATVIRLDTGLTTWSREYARDGLFGRKEIRRRIRETAMAKQELLAAQEEFHVELSWEECFRGWKPGVPAAGEVPAEKEVATPDDDEGPDY